MTPSEIIDAAREAGSHEKYAVYYMTADELQRFAAIIAAKQRENDAKIADVMKYGSVWNLSTGIVSCGCAEAIRRQE